jgi:hypothetical protein
MHTYSYMHTRYYSNKCILERYFLIDNSPCSESTIARLFRYKLYFIYDKNLKLFDIKVETHKLLFQRQIVQQIFEREETENTRKLSVTKEVDCVAEPINVSDDCGDSVPGWHL